MAREWKVGDWCEYKGVRHLVYNVTSDGYGVYLVARSAYGRYGHCSPASDDSYLKHLPDCTGWDWKPPKPIVPPEGYRLVTEGNVVEGDRLLANDGNWYECMGIGNSIAKALASGCGAKAYARKIEQPKPIQPPPGYRLLTDGERIEPSDLFLFGMNWETGAQVGVFTYHLHVPHARKIQRYRPFANAAEFAPYRDKWVMNWSGDNLSYRKLITEFDDDGVWDDNESISWEDMAKRYKFEDGTPFGVPE